MKDTLITYNKNNELLDGKYIKKFNEKYIEENNLVKYYNKTEIDFLSKDIANYQNKVITINLDLFVKKILKIQDYNIFELDNRIIIKLNELLIKTLFHELIHVEQFKKIEEGTLKYELDLLKNSLEQINKNPIKYNQFHKFFPVEWNANIISEYKTKDFMNLDNDNLELWYKDSYTESSPLEKYFYYTNQDFNEYLVCNYKELISLTEYQKFIYGMKIKKKGDLYGLN